VADSPTGIPVLGMAVANKHSIYIPITNYIYIYIPLLISTAARALKEAMKTNPHKNSLQNQNRRSVTSVPI
jgi:hypothetical protein